MIELLVVMAIMAIVMILSVAFFGKAASKARAARCVAQLRHIGINFSIYSAEHNGIVMPCYALSGETAVVSQSGFRGAWFSPFPEGATGLGKRADGQKQVICGENLGEKYQTPDNPFGAPYTVNFNLMRPSATPLAAYPILRLVQIPKPSQIVLMTDSAVGQDWDYGFWNVKSRAIPETKHGEHINVLFLDLRVVAMKRSELKNENIIPSDE